MTLIRWIRLLYLKHSIHVMRVTLFDGDIQGQFCFAFHAVIWFLLTVVTTFVAPVMFIHGPVAEIAAGADWLDTLTYLVMFVSSVFLLILGTDIFSAVLAVDSARRMNSEPASRRLKNLEANLRRLRGESVD